MWREATREELFAYYREEFPEYIPALPDHITPTGPKQYAIAFQSRYPIKKDGAPDRDFIRRYPRGRDGDAAYQFQDWDDLTAFFRYPAENDPLRTTDVGLVDPALSEQPSPAPRAVYYSLDHWDRPWMLAVDIDAKDIAKGRAKQMYGDRYDDTDTLLDHAGIISGDPSGFPYEFEDIQAAIEYGFATKEVFEERFLAEETLVLYSGQGVHVYLLDDDRHHKYDEKSREVINDLLEDVFEIPIDPVVTADRKRVMRLPYSLHGEVSRIVQPIDSPDFDFRADAVPESISVSTPEASNE